MKNPEDYENEQAVQDSLLAGEPRKDSFHVNELPRIWREQNYTHDDTRKRWYEFDVYMYRDKFLERGVGQEKQYRSGFVTLSLGWAGGQLSFHITSEPGNGISMN
jgi:hypothetical protein